MPAQSFFSRLGNFLIGRSSPRVFDAGEINDESPQVDTWLADISRSLTPWRWRNIVAASRYLYANHGVVKSVDDKAMYAVGKAWQPRFLGKDTDWGKLATSWIVDKYYPISDVRGGVYDFTTNLYVDSVNVDVSGDFFVLLTETDDGWPVTQRIPSHRIDSRPAIENSLLTDGPYQGLTIRLGVIYSDTGRAVAYRVQTDDGFSDVSARDLIHCFDPSWYDQGRGLPAFTHAIELLRKLKASEGYEAQALEIMSAIAVIETNEEGGPDPSDPQNRLRPDHPKSENEDEPAPKPGQVLVKKLFGGLYKYFRTGTGAKLETLNHQRPGANWDSFWNRVIKVACAGTGWPFEILWGLDKVGGASLRAAISKANRAVQDRQLLLLPVARREVQYAIAKAIKIGELPESDDWWRWGFSMPPSIIVDIGRQQAQDREDFKHKITTLQDILEPQGKTVEGHYRQLAYEDALLEEIAKETGRDPIVLGKIPKPTVVDESIKD